MNPEAYKMFSVEDKVIIITGGAGFLGMQFALALGKAGAKVVIWDSCDFDRLQASATQLRSANIQNFVVMKVDITDEQKVKKWINNIITVLGKVDVLVNNAAMNPEAGSAENEAMFTPYERYPIDLWKKEIEINLTGMEICTRAVASHMIKRREGKIINIASEFSNIAPDNRIYGEGRFKSSAYVASKGGVLALTRAWASYLGRHGICVNAFTPGGMPKPDVSEKFREKLANLNMLGRIPEIGEHNGTILFLCSDASSFMTGQQLIADAGRSAW